VTLRSHVPWLDVGALRWAESAFVFVSELGAQMSRHMETRSVSDDELNGDLWRLSPMPFGSVGEVASDFRWDRAPHRHPYWLSASDAQMTNDGTVNSRHFRTRAVAVDPVA
jgi:hypothetical protein